MLLPFEKHWASFISYPTRDRRVARPKLLLKKSVQTCVPRSSPLLAKAGQLPRQNPVPSPGDSTSFSTPPTGETVGYHLSRPRRWGCAGFAQRAESHIVG